MTDRPRLIEAAFPLKQASIDSLHEKSAGRAGHISTLHIWPARRPLAASRAALIATLLSDPVDEVERKRMVERIGGSVVRKEKADKITEETVGGLLHWGRESGPELEWAREQIRKAYGGRPPRVLDPFAGGGAIPLEAMRLGCEAVAVDINPVAWFILRCTLRYPQRLAGETHSLPRFALDSPNFFAEYRKKTAAPKRSVKKGGKVAHEQGSLFDAPAEELPWHVRAWGQWVLDQARADLGRFYPNANSKPTMAYLWARTVKCKNCRADVPLLKTRWLCRTKANDHRVLLTIAKRPGGGLDFGIESNVPIQGATSAQKRDYDRRLGEGTMSDAGAKCPHCPAIMTSEDIRLEAQSSAEAPQGRLGQVMTAVVVASAGPQTTGKEYRLPTSEDLAAVANAEQEVVALFSQIPLGEPVEAVPKGGSRTSGGSAFTAHLYAMDEWRKLFTRRQLLALGTFLHYTREAWHAMKQHGYSDAWREAVVSYLAAMLDRLANQCSMIARWNKGGQKIEGTFARFALPMVWDFAEVNPIGTTSGGYEGAIDWVSKVVAHLCAAEKGCPQATVMRQSAITASLTNVDVVVTDPPYYDAIPYSDLMDFFYVWLRRTLHGLSPEIDAEFAGALGPKWDHSTSDGELIDDASRFGGDKNRSKQNYEDGMSRAFKEFHAALSADGRLVIVFAHKEPDAWETLVAAIIRAGFVVDGSWPIQTERSGRTRSLSSAALSSSVWLVCKKRPEAAKPGWDNRVLDEMRQRIHTKLRDFWDAGIRGPDFIWAATGPALQAYSRHPVVKKANEPGKAMDVGEFLRQVRRIVVDFVVGRVLTKNGDEDTASGLDDVTTYYLLHRHDFSLGDGPAGACILYAVSCNLRDQDLTDQYDLLARAGGKKDTSDEDDGGEDDSDADEPAEGSGSKVRIRTWEQRKRKGMGYDAEGRPAPLIDQVHRLMHIWRAGDVARVDEYLDARVLRKSQIFHQLLQALIELAPEGSEERALLESISNHVSPRTQTADKRQVSLPLPTKSIEEAP